MQHQLYGQIRRIEADHWWYVGRRAIAFDWIERTLQQHNNSRVLDIGCGTGLNLEELNSRGATNAVGLDIAVPALEHCRSRGQRRLVRADGAKLPFADNSFDLIVALDLIEHIDDDESALRDIARVLAPGGHVVIFTPAYQFLWSLQDIVSHHRRRYTSPELSRKLRASGLEIEKLSYANTLLFPLVYVGRLALRFSRRGDRISENELHPSWSNGVLGAIFSSEARLIRHMNLPFGVSLLALAVRRRV